MPSRGSYKTARLLRLVAQLEAGPRSAADLARQLGVSQRTLQRDLEELPEIGHAVERDGRRYRLRAGSTTLDPVEALAVHSATRLLAHHTRVNERGYRTALTKIANQLPEPARGYLHASVADIEALSSEGSRALDHVAQAWFEGRVLRFDYHAPIGSGRPHRNDLETYFVEIGATNLAPYVIGYDRSFFKAIRTFALDRIENVRVLDERYTIPADFAPDEHLSSAWGIVAGPRLEVRLRSAARSRTASERATTGTCASTAPPTTARLRPVGHRHQRPGQARRPPSTSCPGCSGSAPASRCSRPPTSASTSVGSCVRRPPPMTTEAAAANRVTQRRVLLLAWMQVYKGDAMVRALSLNVTDRGTALHRPLLARLDVLAPDTITLQEVRSSTVGRWRVDLEAAGYRVADTFELARQHGLPHPGPLREDGLLVASRWPNTPIDPTGSGLPWTERLLSVVVDHPDRTFELHTTQVPNASTGIKLYRNGQQELGRERMMKKLETFEGVHRALTASHQTPRVLTGDFNTPHTGRPDGTVRYWQHSCPAPLRPELEAERELQ